MNTDLHSSSVMPAVVGCSLCPNDTRNPSVRVLSSGLCQFCQRFTEVYRPADLARERAEIATLVGGGRGHHDALFGLSGGKDSAAALVRAVELGFNPLAFTFATGYYPDHIAARARQSAVLLGVDHAVIDLRDEVRPSDLESFRLTADLYDEPEGAELARRFRRQYAIGRRRFSIRYARSGLAEGVPTISTSPVSLAGSPSPNCPTAAPARSSSWSASRDPPSRDCVRRCH